MKPKILIIITRSEIGGAQNYALSITSHLQHKYNFDVAVGTDDYLSQELRKRNINVHVIPHINSKNAIGAIYSLVKLIKEIKPKIINTHSTLASFYGRVANSRAKIPLIYSVHGWFFADNASLGRKLFGPLIEIFLGRFTTYWITETLFDLNMGIKYGAIPDIKKASAIPNGVPATEDKKLIKLNNEFIQLVFVGRISYQKNPELALKTLSLLPKNYKLTMYCDNANNQLILKLIHKLNINDRVELIDNENNTASIIHSYQLLLVTSRYEGMPLTIIEAMSAGLAIVSSDVCGLNELVAHGENGYLVKNRSPEEFAMSIESVFKNPNNLQKMKSRSRELYNERHTINQMVQSISETFDNHLKPSKEHDTIC